MDSRIFHIAKLELTHAIRNRGFRWLSALLLTAFVISTMVSYQSRQSSAEESHSLQHLVQEQWESQPDRHPHRVAHYGYLAFRPRPVLGFFDLGVTEFTGNSIFLEAHVQNSANFSEAKQESSLLRFGRLTPAFLLQILVPLLIIFQCGSNVTRERESSTLAQILSLGVSWRTVLTGKVLGGILLFSLLLIPLVTGITLIALQSSAAVTGDILSRLVLLAFLYTWYLCAWVVLATAVSARSRSTSVSIVTLLGLWIILTTLIPKVLPSLGAYLYAAPSRPELEHSIHLEAVKGGHGHDPKAVQFQKLKEDLFEEHGVEKVEDLPVNWRGIAMREGEKATAEVYHAHYQELAQTFARQNSLSEAGALFDPYLLTRDVSSALCGTDLAAATHFEEEAEEYRYNLIQKLNDLHIEEIDYEGDKKQRLSSVHWDEFEPFRLTDVPVAADVGRIRLLFMAMGLQSLFLLVFLYFTPRRPR